MNLNKHQHAAVHHKGGPLLIIAGAGTGKTTVITQRIKHLIEDENLDPYHLFAATFTEKASEEMRNRLDEIMPFGYEEPWLGTFHSLCERLLQTEGLEIGINPSFKILSRTDQWLFIREHFYDFELDYYRPLGNPTKYISALIKFFSRLSDEDVSVADFGELSGKKTKEATTEAEIAEATRLSELSKAYATYSMLKYEHAVMDFGDLITQSLRLLRTRPNITKKYQEQFKHILVDEFQDTNYAQFELIKLLAPPEKNPNLVVVGDDDQSVYKFRGASVSNILEFKEVYPKAAEVVLTDNYRSTKGILDGAYHSIVFNNPDRLEAKLSINKQLTTHTQSPVVPQVLECPTIPDEVAWTVNEVSRLVAEEGLSYQNIAILGRANSHLEAYAQALKSAKIPYQLIANQGLFDQPDIQTLINFLKVVADPTDTLALFQLSQSRLGNIPTAEVLASLKIAKSKSQSLFEALKNNPTPTSTDLINLITSFQEIAGTKTASQLLYQLIETTGYVKHYIQEESVDHLLSLKNLNIFFNQLKRFEITATDKSIVGYLQTLDMWLEAGENPGQAQVEDVDTVSLMTIHAAKGLEFDAVFLGNLVAGRFPSSGRKDPIDVPEELIKETLPSGNEHLQEERRLFYVALTRAKRFLYLTFAKDLGGVRKPKMSGFIKETELPIQSINSLSTTESKTNESVEKPVSHTITTVSYSQIDTFEACPLKYKYRYLLQIPAPPHHSLSFGRTIHQTLYEFHMQVLQGKSMTLKELLEAYKRNFVEEGYQDAEHKELRFKEGKESITDYYHQYAKIFGTPKLLEQPFRLKLPNATLVGKIDRIDQYPDGHQEIVDYKTGSHKDQKEVDRDEQLTIYALAAKEALHTPINTMSLYFIEKGGKKVTTTRTPAQLDKAKTKLEHQIHTMQTSAFPAKPDPVKCGFCEYYSICPFAAKKQI